MKTPPPASPLDEIRETPTFTARGRTFPNIYAARRHVAEEELRTGLHKLGTPGLPALDPIKPKAWVERYTAFDDNTEAFRLWIIEHVHEILPVLKLVAETHPKVTMVAVEADA